MTPGVPARPSLAAAIAQGIPEHRGGPIPADPKPVDIAREKVLEDNPSTATISLKMSESKLPTTNRTLLYQPTPFWLFNWTWETRQNLPILVPGVEPRHSVSKSLPMATTSFVLASPVRLTICTG